MESLDHDAAYKGFYGHAFMVEELARWLLPPLGRRVGNSSARWTSARWSVVQEQSVGRGTTAQQRHGLAGAVSGTAARTTPRRGCIVVLMLEFQSEVDHLMALRCRQYVDNFHMENLRGRRFGAADRLPPVLVFVIYNGVSRWTAKHAV